MWMQPRGSPFMCAGSFYTLPLQKLVPTMIRYLLWLSLPLYIADQITKWLIVLNFPLPTEGFRSITVIEGFFEIVRVHNKGIAFGKFNSGEYANPIFACVAGTALVLILYFWKKMDAFPTRVGKVAASLIVAGILGNVTDRLVHGYVVDFLQFDLKFRMWPSFNVADACICVAAGLMFVSVFQPVPTKAKAADEAETPASRPEDTD
jgi:signal peptidase II